MILHTGSGAGKSASANSKPKSDPWALNDKCLAEHFRAHFVNRHDAHGAYWTDKEGVIKQYTVKEDLTLEKLAAHFRATCVDDVRGAHAIGRDESGKCWSRWGAVDIDRHGDDGDPDVNLRFGLALYEQTSQLGFVPLLYDSNGRGGYHLTFVFREPVPTADVFALMKWIVRDRKEFGFEDVETFPKQAAVTDKQPFGNWLRLPGRHPKRDHYTRVYDGRDWLEGYRAIAVILGTQGADPSLIPDEAREFVKPRSKAATKAADKPVTFEASALALDALKSLNGAFLDDYDRWLDVGFSLTSLGLIGLGMWDQWSRQSAKYEDGACQAKWGTFSTEGITIGSLFHWAEREGWRDPRTVLLKKGNKSHPTPPPAPPEPTPEPATEPDCQFNCTDMGNGERLAHRHGLDLKYAHPWKKFLVWDKRRWALDKMAVVAQKAKNTVRSIYAEAAAATNDGDRKELGAWANESESRSRLAAMMECVTSEPGIPVLPEQLDRDPWLLNCRNGTLDLRTATLREHNRADGITALCPVKYDAQAVCPLWIATLATIFAGDLELIAFWQRLCGLALTGMVTEQILPILYGIGANGKSTILGVLLDLLGPDYSCKAPPELLMVKRGESHPTERAFLFGKRLVVAIETGEGARINETMIKELTGGDPITARRMREDFWTFKPVHKVLLCTNHRPAVRGTDYAIWRRLRLISFTTIIPVEVQDKNLPSRLAKELPGILAWCVRGCMDWQKEGLKPPAAVVDATEAYKQDEDVIGAFLAEHTLKNAVLNAKASALYERYRKFTEASGEVPVNQRKFGSALIERGFERYTNNGTFYRGLGLRHEESTEK